MDRVTSGSRVLMAEEKQKLRQDMQESSAWAKAELKRRRAAKNQKNLHMVSVMVLRKMLIVTNCYLLVISAR